MVDAFRPIYSQFMPICGQDEIMGGEQGRLATDGDICRYQERPEQVKSTGHEQRAVAAGGEGGGRVGGMKSSVVGCGDQCVPYFALCAHEVFQLRFALGVSCNIEWKIRKQNLPALWFLGGGGSLETAGQ